MVTMVPGLRTCATRASNARLISRFSATTSMIQSASAQSFRSSSKFPVTMRFSRPRVKNAAGLDFAAAARPARTMRLRTSGLATVSPRAFSSALGSGGTISSSAHQTPALAICAAIRAPMVPAPRTTTFSMDRFIMVPVQVQPGFL